MATRLYLDIAAAADSTPPGSLSTDWDRALLLSRGPGGGSSIRTTSGTGPTSIQYTIQGGGPISWWFRVKAVTIAGAITKNIWCDESLMTANCGPQVIIDRHDSAGTFISTVQNSSEGTEMGTSSSAHLWSTGTVTSTAFADGDYIRVRVYLTDAGGTMASGIGIDMTAGGTTAGASGDTYIQFTEAIQAYSSGPTAFWLQNIPGSNTDSTPPGNLSSDVDLALDTVKGTAQTNTGTPTQAGPATIQATRFGGNPISWWYRVNACTISGTIVKNLWVVESTTNANTGPRILIDRCDSTGAFISTVHDSASGVEMTGSQALQNWSTGSVTNTTFAQGDYIRVRLYGVDAGGTMQGSLTFFFYVSDPGYDVSGDSFIVFADFVPPYVAPTGVTCTVINGTGSQLVNVNAGGTDVDAMSYKESVLLTETEAAALASTPGVFVTGPTTAQRRRSLKRFLRDGST